MPPRVASLIASSTEIICALGQEPLLVGRSHECDYPLSVTRLPVLTEPKLPLAAPSAVIDREVRRILSEALSVYRVDVGRLTELAPDVIVTQSHCQVCAVSLDDVQAACATLPFSPRLVSLEPNALADLWRDIARVAEALGVPERGQALCAALRGRMDDIATRARALPSRPSVACIEWIEPLMSAGNWMPELVEMAGGASVFGEAGKHSPFMSWQELRARDPEIILILPCGFDIARTRLELDPLVKEVGWSSLRAVRNRQVFVADGNQYFNRPGPRLVESLEILAELIHPEACSFGHRGRGWQPI